MTRNVFSYGKPSFRLLYIMLCVLFSSAGLMGQNYDEMSLEDLLNIKIEVASNKGLTIFNMPSDVSVIERSMIKKYNFRSVAEVLQSTAGVSVMRTYFKRNIVTTRNILQPHYANKTLVLINGIPQWNAVTGETSIDRININEVERIEVLRGPASVFYGTNAYTGAVNIILLEPDSTSAAIHIGAGLNGMINSGAIAFLHGEELSASVSAHTSEESGHDYLFTDENGVQGMVPEFLRENAFTLTADYNNHTFLFNSFVTRESFLGNNPLFASGAGKEHISDGFIFSYNYQRELGMHSSLKFQSLYDFQQRNFARSADGNIRTNLKGGRAGAKLTFSTELAQDFTLEAGAEYEFRKSIEYRNYDAITEVQISDNNMQNKSVYEYSAAAQLQYIYSKVTFLAGGRYTKNELFGNNFSSRGSIVFLADEKQSVKLNFGQSFRTPSLFELYFRTPDNNVFGSTSLKPETSNSAELAYLVSSGDVFFQVLGYFSSYRAKIFRVKRVPDNPADGSVIYANGGDFNAKGIETELRYNAAEKLDAFINYSYSTGNSGDEDPARAGHYNFTYIPAHTLAAGAAKNLFGLTFSVLGNYRGKSNSLFGEVKAGITFDFNWKFAQSILKGRVEHNFSVKNVFDETVYFPEYTVRNIKEIPSGYSRRFLYELKYEL